MSSYTEAYLRKFYSAPGRLEALRARAPLDEPSQRWLDENFPPRVDLVPLITAQMEASLEHFADNCERQMLGSKCECGSGSDEPSGAHSHWCRCWVAP